MTSTLASQTQYEGLVTATAVESAFVGIYYFQACINGSTTTYEGISSSQTYSNVTVYPSNISTQDLSDFSVTVATTISVPTFVAVTTAISGPPTTTCLIVHPMP